MQTTVYSTTTDVKIHKAIRREWDGFLGWLVARQHELQLRGKTVKTAKLLAEARAQWLACVRARQLHLEHWVMTPEEKGAVQRALGWSQQEMVDAYAAEQEKMGAKYQRVDPTSFGEAGEVLRERFMHPPLNAEQPAYAHWAAEISSPSPGSSYRSPGKQPSVNNMSAELPNMPLYFVGALLRGTDLDAVAEAELEAFALGASEEKIREYYAEACEATVRFQRHIGGLPDDEQRDAATARFDDKMKKLAAEKAAEWKARVVKELRRYKAAQVEMRAAQYRATQMRPHTSPKTRTPRQQPSEWGYFSPQSWNGTTLSPYASPAAEGWGQQQSWGQGWGQTTDTNAWYNSPRGEPANMKEKKPKPKKEKPRQQQQQQQQQDPWGQPLPQQQPEPTGTKGIRLWGLLGNGGGQTGPGPGRIHARGIDWSEVLVDEMDSRQETRRSRDPDAFFVRLDRTQSRPARTTSKLVKKRPPDNGKEAERERTDNAGKGRLVDHGPGGASLLRGGVSDAGRREATTIAMEKQVGLGTRQAQAYSKRGEQRHWLGDTVGRRRVEGRRIRFANTAAPGTRFFEAFSTATSVAS